MSERSGCLPGGRTDGAWFLLAFLDLGGRRGADPVRPTGERVRASQPASQPRMRDGSATRNAHARTYITIVLSTNHQTIHLSNLEMAYRDSEWGRVGPRLVSYEYLRRGRHELATSTSTVSLASGTGVCRVSDQTGSSKWTIIFNVRKSQDRGKAKIPQKQG